MLLLIDVGNSNIFMGTSDGSKIIQTFRLKSNVNATSDEYYFLFKGIFAETNFDNVIISSVVPIITSAFVKLFKNYFNIDAVVIGAGIKTGIMIKADDPHSTGADLICDCVGASLIEAEGLIIDLGTATKYIYYKNNCLQGVSIAPGVSVSMKAMISNTALLPNIELITPKKVLNNNTIACMQSGVIYGFASSVDGMIDRIKAEINDPNLPIIATGGLAKLLIPLLSHKVIYDPELVLKGILSIYNRNFSN